MGSGFTNDVMHAENVDFRGVHPPVGQVTADGQLLIGSAVAPNIRTGTIANGTNIAWTAGAGTLQANLSGPPSSTNLTNHGVVIGQGNSALVATTAGSTGQLLVATTGSDPAFAASANGDFTFTSSTSGATRTLTVTNTSNTASSAANVQVTVAGGTAADPQITQTVTGVTSWSHGIDNSDSDAFVISQGTALGTNNIMRASTDGEINYPLQPAFLAQAAGQSNVTGDSTLYTVTFTSEIFDQNNDFDGTSTFTAPVTGRYQLSTLIGMSGLTASHTAGLMGFTTSNRGYNVNLSSFATQRSAANLLTIGGSILVDMDAGDTVIVVLQATGGTKVVSVGAASYFSGILSA